MLFGWSLESGLLEYEAANPLRWISLFSGSYPAFKGKYTMPITIASSRGSENVGDKAREFDQTYKEKK